MAWCGATKLVLHFLPPSPSLLSPFPPSFHIPTMDNSWIPVLSRAEKREMKRQERIDLQLSEASKIIEKRNINYASLVDPKTGYPTPVDMKYPTIQNNMMSSLLCEQIGTTEPKSIASAEYDDIKLNEFLSKYPVPIYHITYEEHTDMGYSHKYKCRAPYIESIDIMIWTFTEQQTPVIHMYTQDVDRYNQSKRSACKYGSSYSPCIDVEYMYLNEKDVLLRMIELAGL